MWEILPEISSKKINFMSDYNILYKIIILKMLDMAGGSLNTDLINSFFIDNNYTDYFTVQETIYELVEQKMISNNSEAKENNSATTNYDLTEDGRKTLSLMSDRITAGILQDLTDYFSKNKLEIKENQELSSSYDASLNGGFIVHLSMGDKGDRKMDISIKVPSEEMAQTIVFNWKSHFDKTYESIIDSLT